MSFEACFWVELFSLPFPRFFVPLGFGFCCGLFSGWVLVVLVCVGFLLFLCGFFVCGGFGGHGVGVYT